MTDHLTSTKAVNGHTPSPLGSVANTLINQQNQKIEPIDYTADESMIAVSFRSTHRSKQLTETVNLI